LIICPVCSADNSNQTEIKNCVKCGADLSDYAKINYGPDALYNHSLKRIKSEDYIGAIELLAAAAALRPNDKEISYLLAELYVKTDNLEAAMEKYQALHDLFPDDLEISGKIDLTANKIGDNIKKAETLKNLLSNLTLKNLLDKICQNEIDYAQLKKEISSCMETAKTDSASNNLQGIFKSNYSLLEKIYTLLEKNQCKFSENSVQIKCPVVIKNLWFKFALMTIAALVFFIAGSFIGLSKMNDSLARQSNYIFNKSELKINQLFDLINTRLNVSELKVNKQLELINNLINTNNAEIRNGSNESNKKIDEIKSNLEAVKKNYQQIQNNQIEIINQLRK